MNKMSFTSSAILAAGISIVALSACEPTRFESKDFNDPAVIQKEADAYWKRDSWWGGLPHSVHKVAITQFAVEYVTENVSKSGASAFSALGVLEMGGMGHRKREFPASFKAEFPTRAYEQFVTALKASGIDVVPMNELTQQPAFATMKAAAGSTNFGQSNRNESAKVDVYPVAGLPLLDNGWFGLDAGNNMRVENKLIGDSGADAGLRVRIRVALDDDGHAVLGGGSTIHAEYDFKKQQWVPNQPADWVSQQRGGVTGGPALRDENPVVDSKEFKMFQGDIYKVDAVRFEQSILKMLPSYTKMAVVKLKS